MAEGPVLEVGFLSPGVASPSENILSLTMMTRRFSSRAFKRFPHNRKGQRPRGPCPFFISSPRFDDFQGNPMIKYRRRKEKSYQKRKWHLHSRRMNRCYRDSISGFAFIQGSYDTLYSSMRAFLGLKKSNEKYSQSGSSFKNPSQSSRSLVGHFHGIPYFRWCPIRFLTAAAIRFQVPRHHESLTDFPKDQRLTAYRYRQSHRFQ